MLMTMLGLSPVADYNAARCHSNASAATAGDMDEFGGWSGGDTRKLEAHLEQAANNYCAIFQVSKFAWFCYFIIIINLLYFYYILIL